MSKLTTEEVRAIYVHQMLTIPGGKDFGPEFDVWLESVKREAWHSVAPLIECERCGHQWT